MCVVTGLLIAAGAASVGSEVYSGVEQSEAEEKQEEALRQQEQRAKAAAAQQQVQRDDKLEMIHSQQRVAAVQSGMALTSGTFQSLSDAAYSNFAKASKVGNLNLEIQEDDINSKISAARQNLSSEHWGDFFGSIGDVANIALIGEGIPGSKPKMPSGSDFAGKVPDINKTWSQGTSATNWWDRQQNWQNPNNWS